MIAGDVVLVTDGDGIGDAALREATAIRAKGWHLHGVFVPAGPGLPTGSPKPDRGALERLADAGAGRFAVLDQPAPVLDAVGVSTAQHLAAGGYTVLAFADLGRWLVLLALLPALVLFRRAA